KGEGSYSLRLSGAGQLLLRRNSVATVTTSTQAITDTSSWHHVAATLAGSVAHLYLDGVDVTGSVTPQTMADTTTPLSIGAGDGGGRCRCRGGRVTAPDAHGAAVRGLVVGRGYAGPGGRHLYRSGRAVGRGRQRGPQLAADVHGGHDGAGGDARLAGGRRRQ